MARSNGNGSDKKRAQTIDGETGKPDPTPRRIDLSTLKDVRIELAALYRKIDANELESSDGSRRAYILKTIGDIIALAEMEKRLTDLEEKHATLNAGGKALPYRPVAH